MVNQEESRSLEFALSEASQGKPVLTKFWLDHTEVTEARTKEIMREAYVHGVKRVLDFATNNAMEGRAGLTQYWTDIAKDYAARVDCDIGYELDTIKSALKTFSKQ